MIILLNLLLIPSTFDGAEHYISKLAPGMHQVSEISIFPQFYWHYVRLPRTISGRTRQAPPPGSALDNSAIQSPGPA
jgi:hypothetical protein